MIRNTSPGRFLRSLAAIALAASTAQCSLFDQAAPALTGPSERGTSFTMTASPDQLPRDGFSQSVVTVRAWDAQSQPKAGEKLAVYVSGTAASISTTSVQTGADGSAQLTVTAPAPTTVGNEIEVRVVPEGTNLANTPDLGGLGRSVKILILNSNLTVPVPSFTVSPSTPTFANVITFDASETTDEGGACGSACSYSWSFGDGSTGTGVIATHQYAGPGTYTVTLTVVDAAGTSASTTLQLQVLPVAAPTVTFTNSPTSPAVGRSATFTATATPATGHFITKYTWQWGDGSNDNETSTPTIVKSFSKAGTFSVTVTVTDDLGQTGSATRDVTVASGMTPSFTVSPSAPSVGQAVNFNATATTIDNGNTITSYAWDFGDGTSASGTAPTISKAGGYGAAGSYTVTLTITDSSGNTATTTRVVTVS